MTSRRNFIKKTSKTAFSLSVLSHVPFIAKEMISSPPSDRINLGLIGCKGRGYRVLQQHLQQENIKCLALCDIDDEILVDVASKIQGEFKQESTHYKDYRMLLEDKDIDAVIIGTPDHWHCLQTVDACKAGKDVYVEKPMANSIAECEQMVRAGDRYNRIIQVGQQQRSSQVWKDVMDYVKSGRLGRLRRSNIWANFNYGLGPLKKPNGLAPKGVDYNMWLGPAPQKPFNESRFHGSWRFFWDYGGGLMTDWGVHLIDMAFWAKDIENPPSEVLAYGSQIEDPERARETFDNMTVIFPFDDYIVQWEHSAGVQHGPYEKLYGVAFIGDNGTLVADRRGWQVFPEWDNEIKAHKIEAVPEQKGQSGHALHPINFLEAIKTRKQTACPAHIGSAVAVASHMANIAVRTGAHKLVWDNQKGKFKSDKEASRLIKPAYRKPWIFPKI